MSAEGLGKKWYQSRGMWIGLLTFLIGAVEVVIQYLDSGDYSPVAIAMAVMGVLKVAERITSTGESVNL